MFEFKKTGQQQKQRFRLRAWVGGLFALACFGVLVGRFWYLQVDRYEGLSERADRNRIAVVLASGADVQASEDSGGNTALAAKEAVREPVEGSRPDDFDLAHSAFRMMMSSSACSPTMKS